MPSLAGGHVRHRPGIDVRLRDRVAARAGDGRPRRQAAGRQRRAAHRRDLVVAHRDRRGGRHVARVAHHVLVGHHVADHRVRAARGHRLHQRQRRRRRRARRRRRGIRRGRRAVAGRGARSSPDRHRCVTLRDRAAARAGDGRPGVRPPASGAGSGLHRDLSSLTVIGAVSVITRVAPPRAEVGHHVADHRLQAARVTVFTSASAPAPAVGPVAVAVASAEVVVPSLAEATFVTEPASMSPCVIV